MKTFTPQEIKEFIGSIRSADKQHSAVYLMIADDIITYLQQREKTLRKALIPLTDAYLNAMQARCDAATHGPWAAFIKARTIQVDIGDKAHGKRPNIVDWTGFDGCGLDLNKQRKNAAFIAAARTDMPRLIAEVRALHAWHQDRGQEIDRLIAECIDLRSQLAEAKADIERWRHIASVQDGDIDHDH